MNKKSHKTLFECVFGIVFLFAIWGTVQTGSAMSRPELKDLYDKKRYFDLRDKLAEFENDNSVELLFYRGATANLFNSPERSIGLLNLFLKKVLPNHELRQETYLLLADNYVKTFQYAKAARMYQKILREFSRQITPKEKAGFENAFRLWTALRRIPKQSVRFEGDSKIQGVTEPVGLTVPLEINDSARQYLIFDTGANLSVVSKTLARKLKMEIINEPIEVGSITGGKVKAELGTAKKLKLGNIRFENVIFLVFPDEALFIEPIRFQINGILGFPVISALREITWTKDKQISVPCSPQKKAESNLALEGFTPLIAGRFNGKRMAFAFDTGANTSSFYPPFFKAFEVEIIRTAQPTVEKISGVGGTKEIKAYIFNDLKMEFAGKPAIFRKAEIFTEKTSTLSGYVYGNIGRDLLEQFETLTLNFQTMFLVFE